MALPVRHKGITFKYGVRRARYLANYHTGDDYAAPYGTAVKATRSGTVKGSGWNVIGKSYGIAVTVQTGRVRHCYCHLSVALVSRGQKVKKGQLIGRVGSTGASSGPHLHYEERTSPYGYWQHRKPRFNRSNSNKSAKATVDLSVIRRAYGSGKKSSQVLVLQKALKREVGLNYSSGPGFFGERTRSAYAKWQRKCGYRGKDADGIPGYKTLRKLGKKYGFNTKR